MQKRRRKSKRKRTKGHSKIAVIAVTVFASIVLLCGIAYFMLYREVNKIPKDTICDGIYIGQVDVSGLTVKKAREALNSKAEEYKQQIIIFKAREQKAEASLAELGFEIADGDKLINKAVKYGHEGSVWNRYFRLRELKKEKKIFKPTYKINDETAAGILQERVSGLLPGASDATIARSNGQFVITEETEGAGVETEGTLKAVRAFLNKKWDGKGGEVKVVETVQSPQVTKADLEPIQDKLGTFSTYCGSGQSRVTNIENGVRQINGAVLMPGEEYSAGKAMQPFTADNGYVEGGAFENGEVVMSMAGGICQVSSTLYNAVIYAELEVTSRQPHSMTVNYVKPSRDAAIAGDYKDFRFKNNYDTPIFIEGYIENGKVIFNIYGKETRPAGRTIEFVSETISTEERPKKFEEDAGAAIGKISETSGGYKGVNAQLWKVVYENGSEVSRDVFNKSVYKPSVNKVKVGTSSSNPECTQLVRAAIQTQDEAKIKAAIADAKAKEASASVPEEQPEETPEENQEEKPEENSEGTEQQGEGQ